ncbi:MAG: cupin domain-containing protein [Piscinibacter sp.]|uniref:AraC family transcriptional regulator n=1 Tax=Piscinibacter sp. TaxID=1903157 RepID=UPI003D13ED5D
MADRLSALLQRFELSAQVFHGGPLCGVADVDAQPGTGHLHLLRQGTLAVSDGRGGSMRVEQPSVIFFPRPQAHRLESDSTAVAELVCASVHFGTGDTNPLLRALPTSLVVPLARLPGLDLTQQLLFEEACRPRCGHDAVVNRLAEVLLIQLLRYAIEQRLVDGGLMAGLADPRLHKALAAVHAQPARDWTLPSMAAEAGMSRARFAAHFARCVGVPPGEYLTTWRIGLACTLLRRGIPVKLVAAEVGYANASALGRAFAQRVGTSPAAWSARDGGSARQAVNA